MCVEDFVLKGLPNERLFEFAIDGFEKALLILFDNVKCMWRQNVPMDNTGMNDYDDWVSIGDEEFFLKWREYDINRSNAKFSTWIFSVVRNRWLVELSKLSAYKRKTNVTSVCCSYHSNDFLRILKETNLSLVEFDEAYTEIYYNRFRDYVEANTSDKVFSVFDMRYFGQRLSIDKIASNLDLTVCKVKECIAHIQSLAQEFVGFERKVFNGC